jgi:hypothetical protein
MAGREQNRRAVHILAIDSGPPQILASSLAGPASVVRPGKAPIRGQTTQVAAGSHFVVDGSPALV